MAIEYHLVKAKLETIKGRHTARVDTGLTVNVDGMLTLLRTFNSTVSEEEAKSVIIALQKATGFYLQEGYTVDLGFLSLAPRVSGVFDNENDAFDSARHQLHVRARLDGGFVNQVRSIAKISKKYRLPTVPAVTSVFDVTGGMVEDRCFPGGTVQLMGKNLKFDLENGNEGIYLLQNGTIAIEIDSIFVTRHLPTVLEFSLPADVPPGEYSLEVHVKFSETVKKGQYDNLVTVEEARPVLQMFSDKTTGLANEIVTPGGTIRLTGLDLDYGADGTEGVFFIDSADVETRVPDASVTQKNAQLLVFTAPALAAGEYRLEVRKLHSATLMAGEKTGLSAS